jgi:hypothetical protein
MKIICLFLEFKVKVVPVDALKVYVRVELQSLALLTFEGEGELSASRPGRLNSQYPPNGRVGPRVDMDVHERARSFASAGNRITILCVWSKIQLKRRNFTLDCSGI